MSIETEVMPLVKRDKAEHGKRKKLERRNRMTKEVLIHIKTQQILRERAADEEEDVIELIVAGQYYFRNGMHYLLYEETMEGFTESTQNLVKMKANFMEVRKKGTVNVTMTFEKGKKNTTIYKTPFGMFEMEFDTQRVSFHGLERSMEICAEYTLGMQGNPIADCKMQMRVTAQDDAEETTFFR